MLKEFLKDLPLPPNYDGASFDPMRISADSTTIIGSCYSQGGSRGLFRIYNPNGLGENGKLLGIDYGESRLTGTLKSASGSKWVLSASSLTEPGGQITSLTPAREKVILLPTGFKAPVGVKAGAKVIITGADGGKGKPLTARSIEIAPG